MNTKKTIRNVFLTISFVFNSNLQSQNVSVYKINDLLKRIHNSSDTTYVVNFWATWCKPCVAELPDFEKLHINYHSKKVKVILVSMDFKEEIEKRLKAFIQKNQYTAEIILLDEINGNDFINQISEKWSGAIPATLITKNNKSTFQFFEKKVNYEFLTSELK
jgi:thiol-disulfide isomerase/thioredoxin